MKKQFRGIISLLFLVLFCNGQKKFPREIDSLLQLIKSNKEDSVKVKNLAKLGIHYSSSDPAKGIQMLAEALALGRKISFNRANGSIYLGMGWCNRHKSGNQSALSYADSAISFYNSISNKKPMSKAYQLKCVIYIDLSDYPRALDNALKALQIAEAFSDRQQIAGNLSNIGLIYDDMGEYKKAMESHQRALKVFEELGDKYLIALALTNIGVIQKKTGDYQGALHSLEKSLTLDKEVGHKYSMGKSLLYLGQTLTEVRQYEKALETLAEGLSLFSEMKDIAGQAETLQSIAAAYAARSKEESGPEQQKDLKKATEFLNQAADKNKEAGNLKFLSENYKELSAIQDSLGDQKAALLSTRKYMLFKDSFNNTIKDKQLKELQTKYETLEKDKQIIEQDKQIAYNEKINLYLGLISGLLLVIGMIVFFNLRKTAKLNKQINLQKKELENLNNMKDRIFSVIGHDLKAPLNSLVSFGALLENGNIPPEKMQIYVSTLKNNMKYTGGLMENLLNWARSQMQGYKPVMERFDLSEIAIQVEKLLLTEAEKKEIRLLNEISAGSIVYADMNMMALLLRNLISNAIKYTRAGGSVTLSIEKISERVRLIVEDTGIGIRKQLVAEFNTAEAAQPLDSTPGTDHEKGTGLGLMLCKNFASLMNSRLFVESEEGKGSRFILELAG